MRFRDMGPVAPPGAANILALQQRMDSLGLSHSDPGVYGEAEDAFLRLYAQQLGIDVSTAGSLDSVVQTVLPVIDTDISIQASGALRTAPTTGQPITAAPTQITGAAPQDPGMLVLWAGAAFLAAKFFKII